RLADGRRVCRSTGKYNKREAEIVAGALQSAEDEAATGELTRDRFTKLMRETFKRLGIASGSQPRARQKERRGDIPVEPADARLQHSLARLLDQQFEQARNEEDINFSSNTPELSKHGEKNQ